MKDCFSSIQGINIYAKWGNLGLFLYLVFKSVGNLILRSKISRLSSVGWQDPVAPIIVRNVFKDDFRTSDRSMNHPYSSIEIAGKSEGTLDEDLYPLV